MDDGRRLEVEVREEAIEEERTIVESEKGQQRPGVNEIPEIHIEVEANVVEEVRRNENEARIERELEGEGEVREIINIAEDEGENARGISDFLAPRRR
jgi:hypothetical protein